MPGAWPETMPEAMPAIMPETMPAIMPETMPAIMPEIMPAIMPETIPEIGEPFQELNAGIADAGGDELTAGITDEDFIQFRLKCKRFRVLVVGPRNAGKTTILERLTGDSIKKAEIKSPDGKIVRHLFVF